MAERSALNQFRERQRLERLGGRSALNQFQVDQNRKGEEWRESNLQTLRDVLGGRRQYQPDSVAAAEARGDTRQPSPAWRGAAPVAIAPAVAAPVVAAPAVAANNAPIKGAFYDEGVAMMREAMTRPLPVDTGFGSSGAAQPRYAANDLARRGVDLANAAAFMPRYESRTAINIPSRQQAMRENLAMERAAKQGDFYDRMNQVGFVTPELLKMAIQDRQASRALAADSVSEGGRQGLLSQKQALDEARLAEDIGQAEYKSIANRNQMEADLARMFMNAAQGRGTQDVTARGQDITGALGQRQTDVDILEAIFNAAAGDAMTGRRADSDLMSRSLNALIQAYQNPEAAKRPGFADGGEVSMENPTAEGKTAGLDTGDYVFPAEAVRFYGMKTIKAMVEKAMMADDA